MCIYKIIFKFVTENFTLKDEMKKEITNKGFI